MTDTIHVTTVHVRLINDQVPSKSMRHAELAPLFALTRSELAGVTLTFDQFDALVHAWNQMHPFERREQRAMCSREGHERVALDGSRTRICRRCCESVRTD